MLIGGLHRFSLIDYPSKTACVIFTQGCNFRCPYCHNPELVEMSASKHRLMHKPVFDFLKKRSGKLDGVVITGGEPTLQQDLISFIQEIKALGFSVKIDTNGTNATLLSKLLGQRLIDAVAMDIKAPFSSYERVTAIDMTGALLDSIKRSMGLIKESSLDYEFRTTVIKDLLSPDDILEIGRELGGAKRYVLQRFVPSKTYQHDYVNAQPFDEGVLASLVRKLQEMKIETVMIR